MKKLTEGQIITVVFLILFTAFYTALAMESKTATPQPKECKACVKPTDNAYNFRVENNMKN